MQGKCKVNIELLLFNLNTIQWGSEYNEYNVNTVYNGGGEWGLIQDCWSRGRGSCFSVLRGRGRSKKFFVKMAGKPN